jgi:hypothetical protein
MNVFAHYLSPCQKFRNMIPCGLMIPSGLVEVAGSRNWCQARYVLTMTLNRWNLFSSLNVPFYGKCNLSSKLSVSVLSAPC